MNSLLILKYYNDGITLRALHGINTFRVGYTTEACLYYPAKFSHKEKLPVAFFLSDS